jgi:hypothetical protein
MPRPFLLQFEEEISQLEMEGVYDSDLQMFIASNASPALGHTGTETSTGGHGDTDSDTD